MDGCDMRPGQACQYGGRLDLLEKRVEDLEGGQEREESFRRTYYADREARLVRDAILDEKMSSMDGKLDKLVSWKEEQLNRPNKLLDGIKDKLVGVVVGAVGAGLVAAAVILIRMVIT